MLKLLYKKVKFYYWECVNNENGVKVDCRKPFDSEKTEQLLKWLYWFFDQDYISFKEYSLLIKFILRHGNKAL